MSSSSSKPDAAIVLWLRTSCECPKGQLVVPVTRPGGLNQLPRTTGRVSQVIEDVDAALRMLVDREAIGGAEVQVVFDAPTKDWAGRRNAPTIDLYLYDIREDMRRRSRGLLNEYEDTDLRARMLPPRHFKLSYLVTAWTQRAEDEHRLLAALLQCFLRHEALPEDVLTGSLAELGLPVPMTVALPPPEDRAFADVWSALGGELKPSLDVVVSAPIDTGQRFPVGPAVSEPAIVSAGGIADWPPRERRALRAPVTPPEEPDQGAGTPKRQAIRRQRRGRST